MTRSKSLTPSKKWTLHIDAEIADRIESILHDPITDKVIFQARARLINALLEEAIRDFESGRRTFDPYRGTLHVNSRQ